MSLDIFDAIIKNPIETGILFIIGYFIIRARDEDFRKNFIHQIKNILWDLVIKLESINEKLSKRTKSIILFTIMIATTSWQVLSTIHLWDLSKTSTYMMLGITGFSVSVIILLVINLIRQQYRLRRNKDDEIFS